MGRLLEDIVHLEPERLSERLNRAPSIGALLEPPDHLVDSKPALDLELAVGAGPSAVDAACRNVGAEDVDCPAAPLLRLLGEQHRQRIDFLPGRAAGGPDAD